MFKQGEPSDLNNYRPILVISVIAKVFERIIYDQLYNFLSNEDIISNHQLGFRSLHSTLTALLGATDDWAFNIDHGNFNAVIFLDLKKALDTVDHNILLSKMNLYGKQGTAVNWFKSYLTNRTQRCFVNGSLSRICSLKCGVPQGTNLGPFLFLIYINDCLTLCQPRMYADDTHITYAGIDVNHDLDNLNKWLISNKLTLSSAKTEFMLNGSRQKLSTLSNPLELSIDNVPIEHVSSVKSLGIFIDKNLRWQTHIDKLSKKVASGIGAIKRIRSFVPPSTLHYIYNALIQSHFDYCNLVWGNCGKTLFDRLQKLQNCAARVLTNSSYDADANPLIRQLDWRDLSTQLQIQKALMVYKSLNGLVPEYLSFNSVNKLFVPFPQN